MADAAISQTKTCSKCGETKPLDRFARNKLSRGGRERRCKACAAKNAKRYREANPERDKASHKAWYAIKGKANQSAWVAKNREKVKEYKRREYVNHAETIKRRVAEWRANNPDKRRAQARRGAARLMATPRGRLDNAMSRAIGTALRGTKSRRSWNGLVGYSVDELMAHLEKQFQTGMTWGNYGKWHVDHKIPKAAFNYSSAEHLDFARCWALSNLQPLWARDNLVKGAKLAGSFQPSLAI